MQNRLREAVVAGSNPVAPTNLSNNLAKTTDSVLSFDCSEIEPTRVRLLAKTFKDLGGCLSWKGPFYHNGYGVFRVKNKKVRAHRASWVLAHGPIPEGKLVLHSCDNRKCVNPEHLRLGTHQENMRDMTARNRQAVGERQHRSRLTADAVRDIRTKRLSLTEFAKLYGVNFVTVYEAQIGRYWKHVA